MTEGPIGSEARRAPAHRAEGWVWPWTESPRLANSRCPIPPKISPHADAVQRWLDDWILRCGMPAASRVTRRVTLGRVARYAGRLYPDATEPDLRALQRAVHLVLPARRRMRLQRASRTRTGSATCAPRR